MSSTNLFSLRSDGRGISLRSSEPLTINERSDCLQFVAQDQADVSRYASEPDRFLGKCIAITSLNPNREKQERQRVCVQSWRDIGMQVIAVNTAAELARLDTGLSRLVHGHVNESTTLEYSKPTQRISSILKAGRQTGMPFMLINSDLQISGDPQVITDALAHSDKLTIGVRYNHEPGQSINAAEYEPWGLDCFLMTPEMAATVPNLPFGIGKPVWDYWLPHHFRSRGYKFHWIRRPFFFHERHPLGWSDSEWKLGARWMQQFCGVPLAQSSVAYRNSLNFHEFKQRAAK
jgi:hypothetical protein